MIMNESGRKVILALTNVVVGGRLQHDGNPVMAEHVRNSRKRMLTVLDDEQRRISAEEGVSFRSVNLQFQRPVEHDFTAPQQPSAQCFTADGRFARGVT